jgi:hypothetical protein
VARGASRGAGSAAAAAAAATAAKRCDGARKWPWAGAMRGLLRVAALVTAALVAQTACVAGSGVPLDVILMIDRSGSIGDNDRECRTKSNMTCFQILATFADAVVQRLSLLAGGYFQSAGEDGINGLRVGALLFKCPANASDTSPNVMWNLTGDAAQVEDGFTRLKEVKPGGNTCALSAMQRAKRWVNETSMDPALVPPARKTSILYMSDGLLTSGQAQTQTTAETIRAGNDTAIFGLSIGKSASQVNEISKITGSKGRIWDVVDVTVLNSVLVALTAFIFGDFRTGLYQARNASDVCQGEVPTLEVFGASVQGLANVECEFSLQGTGFAVAPLVTGVKKDGTGPPSWLCDFPESDFTSPRGEVVEVQVWTVDGTVRRQVGTPSQFSLGRRPCMTVSAPAPERCLGEDVKFSLGGPSVLAFLRPPQLTYSYAFQCQVDFTSAGYNFSKATPGVPTSDGLSVSCSVPEQALERFPSAKGGAPLVVQGPRTVTIVSAPDVTRVSLQVTVTTAGVTIPGTQVRTLQLQTAQSVPPVRLALNSSACVAGDVDLTACWRSSDARARFRGSVVGLLAPGGGAAPAGSRLVCLINLVGASAPGFLADAAVSADGVSCSLPLSLLEPKPDGSLTWPFYTDLFLLDDTSAHALQLSDQWGKSKLFTLSSCVDVQQPDTSCFGDRSVVTLTSQRGVPLSGTGDVSCRFADPENGVVAQGVLTGPAPGGVPNVYTCTGPELVGEYFGVTFSSFELLVAVTGGSASTAVLQQIGLSATSSACIGISASNEAGAFVRDGAVSFCWGLGAQQQARLLFTDRTPQLLRAMSVSCRFLGGNGAGSALPALTNLTVPAAFDDALQGFVCALPGALFLGPGGNGSGSADGGLKTQLVVNPTAGSPQKKSVVVGAVNVPFASRTDAPCFQLALAKVGAPAGLPVCLGDDVELRVLAASASLPALAALPAVAADPANVAVQLAPALLGRVAGDYTAGGDLRVGPLPLRALLAPQGVTATVAGAALLPLPAPGQLDPSAACWSPVIAVKQQASSTDSGAGAGAGRRRALAGSAYCLGDALSVSFAGTTVERALQVYGAGNLSCVFAPAPGSPFVPSGAPDVETRPAVAAAAVTCAAPVWDPFSPSGVADGAYGEVRLVVATGTGATVTLGSPVLLDDASGFAPAVCQDLGFGGNVPAGDGDCRRGPNVTVALSGRTAFALSKPPANVTLGCFAGGAPLGCELTDASTGDVAQVAPVLSGSTLSCSVPGWAPDLPAAGNVSQVRMLVCQSNNVTREVKKEQFAPTAGRLCVSLRTVPVQPCLGDAVEGALAGTSLSAFVAWASRRGLDLGNASFVAAGGDGAPLATVNASADASGLKRARLSDAFLPASPQEPSLALPALHVEVAGTTIADLPGSRLAMAVGGRCVAYAGGLYTCGGASRGTTVNFEGAVADTLQQRRLPGEPQCEFSNSSRPGTVETRPAQAVSALSRNRTAASLLCQSADPYDLVSLVYGGVALNAPAAGVPRDNATCEAASAPPPAPAPPPPADGGSNLGLILGVLFASFFFVALLAMFVVRRRRRRQKGGNEANGKRDLEEGAGEDAPGAAAAGAFHVAGGAALLDPAVVHAQELLKLAGMFKEGSRVEAKGAFDTDQPQSEAWYKGTVEMDMRTGMYQIALDLLSGSGASLVVVAGDMLREPLSDFRQAQPVEARAGQGAQWVAGATVEHVLADDKYTVEYADGAPRETLPGSCLRLARMKMRPGAHVEARLASGEWQRGTIKGVDATAEAYAVALAAGGEPQAFAAADVRPFALRPGDVVDVAPAGSSVRHRATVREVLPESETCQVDYHDVASRGEPTLVSFAIVHRVAFSKGDQVIAKRGDAWLPAAIEDVESATGTYAVRFADNSQQQQQVEQGLGADRVRRPDAKPRFSVGAAVLAETEDGRWHRAKVAASNAANATYDVVLESGASKGQTVAALPPQRLKELPADFVDEADVTLGKADSSPFGTVFRPPPREHPAASAGDGLAVPFHLRFKKRKPLDFAELPNNQFEVALDMSEGLGLSLGWTNDNRVIVAGFRDLPNGDWGPVEACGLVGLKDQLLKVNGKSIGGKSFVEVSELIKNSGKTIRLQFGRGDMDELIGAGIASGVARAS